MTIIVVNKSQRGIVILRGKSEGVFGEDVAVGNAGGAGGAGDGAERGVVIMRGDAVLRGVVEDLGDVLVAIVGVKEIEAPVLGMHDERARGNGFRGIPHKLGADGVAVVGIQPLDAEVVVVNEAEVRGNLIVSCLLIVHAAAKAVEGHRDDRVAELPADGAVFGIVGNRPNAGLSLDEGLIAIVVVLRREVIDGGVLVEVVGGVGLALGNRTVSDVVVGIGNFICRD